MKLEGRTELDNLIQFARAGDSITVTRIDRRARSVGDLPTIVSRLEAKGVSLRVIEHPIDTTTAAGQSFLQMLGVSAEFETAIRKGRQMEGVTKAKAQGVCKGRKRSIDLERVKAFATRSMGATALARELNVARASIYPLLTDETPELERQGSFISFLQDTGLSTFNS